MTRAIGGQRGDAHPPAAPGAGEGGMNFNPPVPCPKCGVDAGYDCVFIDQRSKLLTTRRPHRERMAAYRHATREGHCQACDQAAKGLTPPPSAHQRGTFEHPEVNA